MQVQDAHKPSAVRCRSGAGQWIRTILVIAALTALSAARSVPTDFGQTSSSHKVVIAQTAHDQRPRFDDQDSQWVIPIAVFSQGAPPSLHAGIRKLNAIQVFSCTKGAQYTRPPPSN